MLLSNLFENNSGEQKVNTIASGRVLDTHQVYGELWPAPLESMLHLDPIDALIRTCQVERSI